MADNPIKRQTVYSHAYHYGKPVAIGRHKITNAKGIWKILEMWRSAENWTIELAFNNLESDNQFEITLQNGNWVGPDNNFGYGNRCKIIVRDHSAYAGLMASYDAICSRYRCRAKRPPTLVCSGCEDLFKQ
jgi:hypothetical protein